MRIPYSQLRFKPSADQVWGINFRRDIARRNERDFLVYTPSNASGFVSRFPELLGLASSTRRAASSCCPYATAQGRVLSHDPGDPFNDGSVYGIGVGGDLRVGLGSNLTLNATVNPDFGQVEVDPAVVNLSDVETFFPEKRPFFVEGANTFTTSASAARTTTGDSTGRRRLLLHAAASAGHRRAPRRMMRRTSTSRAARTILGALKLSGKLGGWNFGALYVADRSGSSPTTRWTARRATCEVEPLTIWNAHPGAEGHRQRAAGHRHHLHHHAALLQRRELPDQMNRGAYTLGRGRVELPRPGTGPGC